MAGGGVASAVVATTVLHDRSPMRRLADAVGPHRVVRARLTGGFAYAPCDSVAPNDSLIAGLICERSRPSDWAQAGALSKLAGTWLSSGVTRSSGANDLHATGGWDIVWGNLDRAVDKLRRAAQAAPKGAPIQSDLAAAFLARAELEQDPRWLLDAYNAVDSALALDPRQPEARFNRAIALEWLGLRNDAVSAWSAFLELDTDSPWAGEARTRLQRLRESSQPWSSVRQSFRTAVAAAREDSVRTIASQYPLEVRREARRAVVAWAEAYRADSVARADTLLGYASTAARALAAATGDSLWAHAVESLIEARSPDHGRREEIAQGILAYDRGEAYLGRFVFDSAERSFRESHVALKAAENAAQYWAAFGLASVAYYRQSPNDYQSALTSLRALRATAPNAYHVVRGFSARLEGLIHGIQANFAAAIAAYSDAAEEGRGTGEPTLEIRSHSSLAGNYASLGDDRVAWVHLYDALRSAPRYPGADSDLQPVFTRAADLSARRAPRLASLFQREVTIRASRMNRSATDSLQTIAALIREAELLSRQGRTASALESARRAQAYVAAIESDSLRASAKADVDLVEGQALIVERPDTAVQVLKNVADRYRDTQYFRQMTRAELLLANAYAATGEMDLAQRSFEAALTEVERRRSNITSPEDRARFLDQARPVVDTLVKFLVDRGDTVRALEFLEQMRSRVLLERVRKDSSLVAHLTIAHVRAQLPLNTRIVSYAVLKGELVAWVVARDEISMYRTSIGTDLKDLTSRFTSLLATRSAGPEVQTLAAELHRLLIAPLGSSLGADTRLVIVPDKWLQFVPFAALFDQANDRFLVEQFETVVAPSVELYAESARRYEEMRKTPSRALLSVGNPAFDGRVFSLPTLPGAEREAKRIASFYGQAHVLIGSQATKQAFLHAAASSNVIHFAGHGVVRPDAPLLSYLVLAVDSGKASAALTAQELFSRQLPVTRLAILSGCQTASGQLSDTEGASSLARAFFAAGVPAVVASLWVIDDDATAEFFTDYHQSLSKGEDPSTALRRTQIQWVKKSRWRDVSTWAAFSLFGSTAGRATY